MKKVILAAAVVLSMTGCVAVPTYYTPAPVVYATPVHYRTYIQIPAPVYYQAPQYYYRY